MIMLSQPVASQRFVPPPQAAGYKLAFHDEFDSLDLSPGTAGEHTWYANVWFDHRRPPAENIRVENSQLGLTWKKDQGSDNTSIETASPDGQHVKAWRYGYFEARARWPRVNGAWPAIWMLDSEGVRGENIFGGHKDSGELDIFEGQGDRPGTFFGTIHHWVDNKRIESNSDGRNIYLLHPGADFGQFHNYGVLWEPGKVTWYFDDRPLHSEKTYAVFDRQSYFLILGMQEGVNWKSGDLSGLRNSEMTMYVDWVRVWQK
ncbi:MAG: glycoside hydrolase family 16 protein [Acidobacteriota bacterium]|nr:glycoside hydrolase family 16 protein [Acidobacteriota bacterium]